MVDDVKLADLIIYLSKVQALSHTYGTCPQPSDTGVYTRLLLE
jgi:hypothetical protein